MNNKGNTMIVGIVAVIFGLLLGMGVSSLMKGSSSSTIEAKNESGVQTGKGAEDLRVLINGIQKQHVDLAAATTRAGFDESTSFDAASKSLLANSDELSAAIGSVYGEENGEKFKEIWNSHITFFVNYTVAAKKGDKAGMDQAVKDLGAYVEEISTFLSGANPNLPKDVVAQVVGEHVGLLKAAVDAHGAGNYDQSYAKQAEAYTQIGTIADAVSGAIVKQFPDKFN